MVILPAVTIYALMEQNLLKPREPGALAVNYLVKAPTYGYDGVPGTMKITGVYRARTPVSTWLVNAIFICEHPGYGDRRGEELDQTETNHSTNLIVQEGKVVSAIIDGEWDEINQEPASRNHVTEYDVEENDGISDRALEFLARCPTYRWDGIKETTKVEDVVLLDTSPLQYRVIVSFNSSHAGCGNRAGTDTAALVTPHMAQILLEESEVVSALLDNTWDIIAQRTIQRTSISSIIKDLALEYIIENHHELGNLVKPVQWAMDFERHETRLEEGEITGYTCTQYHSGNWTVIIGHKAVIEHKYDIEAVYQGESWFTWKGQIDTNYNVIELAFESV